MFLRLTPSLKYRMEEIDRCDFMNILSSCAEHKKLRPKTNEPRFITEVKKEPISVLHKSSKETVLKKK